jgi:hypothetical protein
VGNIDVEDAAFSVQPKMDAIRFADIARDPSGSGQRRRRSIVLAPQNGIFLVFEFRRINFVYAPLIYQHEQISSAQLNYQAVVFLVGGIKIPILRRMIVHAEERRRHGLPFGFFGGRENEGENPDEGGNTCERPDAKMRT